MIEKKDFRSPVEDNEELLAEYGRAFALINAIEDQLRWFIYFFGELNLANPEVIEKLVKNKTLGSNIKLAESLLSPPLYEKLGILNKNRNLLAHNAVGEKFRVVDNAVRRTGIYTIGGSGTEQPLTIEFLEEVVDLARTIALELNAEYSKRLQKN